MNWFNFEDPQLHLYEICFPNEYVEEIVSDLCEFLQLPFNQKRLEFKLENDGTPGSNCVYIEQSEENKAFLLLDCSNSDWIYTLCVISDKRLHPRVKDRLLAWDRHCRNEYAQPRPEDYELRNKLKDENSLFIRIIRKHRIG